MKTIIVILVTLVLSACSSTNKKSQESSSANSERVGTEATAAFNESGAPLKLVFDAAGNWTSISAVATADVLDDSPAGRETALMVATMRTKRAFAEFLHNEIKSATTQTRIARAYSGTYQASSRQPGSVDYEALSEPEIDGNPARMGISKQANRMAAMVTERISDNANAILKGAHVTRRGFQGSQAVVELTASRVSANAARTISRQMSGMMQ